MRVSDGQGLRTSPRHKLFAWLVQPRSRTNERLVCQTNGQRHRCGGRIGLITPDTLVWQVGYVGLVYDVAEGPGVALKAAKKYSGVLYHENLHKNPARYQRAADVDGEVRIRGCRTSC
jgi:hypothetical protein